jgi:hypothetical protein
MLLTWASAVARAATGRTLPNAACHATPPLLRVLDVMPVTCATFTQPKLPRMFIRPIAPVRANSHRRHRRHPCSMHPMRARLVPGVPCD